MGEGNKAVDTMRVILYCAVYFAFRSEVQLGQRIAFIGILEKQYGHSFVVGAAAGATSSLRFI